MFSLLGERKVRVGKEGQGERGRGIETDRQTDRQDRDRLAGRRAGRDRLAGRTGRQTETDRQTDRQTETDKADRDRQTG